MSKDTKTVDTAQPKKLPTKPMFRLSGKPRSYHLSSVITTRSRALVFSIIVGAVLSILVSSLWSLIPQIFLTYIQQALLAGVFILAIYLPIEFIRGDERYGPFECLIDVLQAKALSQVANAWNGEVVAKFLDPVLTLEASVGKSRIATYARDRVFSTMKKRATIYSDLCSDGATLPLSEKLEVAAHLHDDDYIGSPLKKCYWATSLDDPVAMWEEQSEDFWERQERLKSLESVDRRRLVVMPPDKYRSILSFQAKEGGADARHRFENFHSFVKWHFDNEFELKFLLIDQDVFRKTAAASNLKLTDFAIFDDDWVFGEVYPPGRDAFPVEDGKVYLIENVEETRRYQKFFERYWRRGERQIPARLESDGVLLLRSEIVLSDLAEAQLRKQKEDSVSDRAGGIYLQYPDLCELNGDPFLGKLIEHLENAKGFSAVDVADLKYMNGICSWQKREYLRIVQASAKAAENGQAAQSGPSKRLYVVNKGITLAQQELEALVRHVFAPQIKAGVFVYIICYDDLRDAPHKVRDFILIDDRIGFGLARWEPFKKEYIGPSDLIEQADFADLSQWAEQWIEKAGDHLRSEEEVFHKLNQYNKIGRG